jgi:hypothetical protein
MASLQMAAELVRRRQKRERDEVQRMQSRSLGSSVGQMSGAGF